MNIQFDSWAAFWAMGGHGPYVWSCYALVLGIMLYLAVMPNIKTRQFFKQQKRMQQRLAAHRAAGESEAGATS